MHAQVQLQGGTLLLSEGPLLASVLRPACRKTFNPKINPEYSLKLGRR